MIAYAKHINAESECKTKVEQIFVEVTIGNTYQNAKNRKRIGSPGELVFI